MEVIREYALFFMASKYTAYMILWVFKSLSTDTEQNRTKLK